MTTTIETTNHDLLNKLQPIIQAAAAYKGHFNKAYSLGSDHIQADIQHRDRLLDQLKPLLPEGFLIGHGSSHIWIAVASGICQDKYSLNFQKPIAKIEDRVLLITD
jgi:hypothetical protein